MTHEQTSALQPLFDKQRSGRSITTSLFSAPLFEFKTKKAAQKMANRIVGGANVVKSTISYFDMFHPEGKPIYQVIEAQND